MAGGDTRPIRESSELPSAATLFRMRLYDRASADLIRAAKGKLQPLLKLRDGGHIKRIQAARTPEELLDLSPQATGLAQDAWHERMRAFGPQALPLIQGTLPQLSSLEDAQTRYRIAALLITELRWRDEPGVQVLLACLDDLDAQTAALACVALGLLRSPVSLQPVWECYLRLKALTRESHFIGGLWGLVDLGDRRAAGELDEYLKSGRRFYELFGFLSLAGDERSLVPLIASAMQLDQNTDADPFMAATAIAHRVEKPVLVHELLRGARPDSRQAKPEDLAQAEEVAALILSRPVQEVEEYFALFYRGFRPQDAGQAFKTIR